MIKYEVTLESSHFLRKLMKIGALAKALGCTVETIRYYEQQGLIPPQNVLQAIFGNIMKNICNVYHLFVTAEI